MDLNFTLVLLGSILLVCVILIASAIKIVPEDSLLTVYRFGRVIGDKGPGIVILIPFVDRGEIKKLDDPD